MNKQFIQLTIDEIDAAIAALNEHGVIFRAIAAEYPLVVIEDNPNGVDIDGLLGIETPQFDGGEKQAPQPVAASPDVWQHISENHLVTHYHTLAIRLREAQAAWNEALALLKADYAPVLANIAVYEAAMQKLEARLAADAIAEFNDTGNRSLVDGLTIKEFWQHKITGDLLPDLLANPAYHVYLKIAVDESKIAMAVRGGVWPLGLLSEHWSINVYQQPRLTLAKWLRDGQNKPQVGGLLE